MRKLWRILPASKWLTFPSHERVPFNGFTDLRDVIGQCVWRHGRGMQVAVTVHRKFAKRRSTMEYHVCFVIPPHIFDKLSQNPAHRTWAMRALAESARLRGRRDVLSQFAAALAVPAGTMRRTIYDAQNQTNLPGTLVRGEGDNPTADVAVNEAYDYAGDTYNFYMNAYQRNSIDNRGMRLNSTL